MSKSKKALIIYLVVSSVILHGVAAYAIYMLAPAMKAGYEMGVRASMGNAAKDGVIKDTCTLEDGDNSYVGYAVDYKGQTLYVMGSTSDGIKKGDAVTVSVTKHPYGPLKGLIVVVTK